MKPFCSVLWISLAAPLATLICTTTWASTPLTADFTYQGHLIDGGAPANGNYDMVFNLYDASSSGFLVGGNTKSAVPVTGGLFTVKITFGWAVWNANAYWLEVNVRPAGSQGAYTTLTPRQSLTATAQALFSAAPWVTNGNDVSYQLGNVGIGTPNPGVALDVVGFANVSQGVVSGLQTVGPTTGAGLYGKSSVSNSNGIIGEASGAGSYGVWGRTDSGRAVYGQSSSGFGGYFLGKGYFSGNVGIGTAAPNAPLHVQGAASDSAGTIHAVQTSGATTGAAIWGQGVSNGNGVVGIVNGSSGFGVFGSSDGGNGVRGSSTNGTGVVAISTNGDGLDAQSNSPTGYAIYAIGRFGASGTKSFRIDHPLDPENKYLAHYCSEGPEPTNVYRGRAQLDAQGDAWVDLPAYFSEINTDPHVQLTPLGTAMPGLHLAADVEGNRFHISGGAPGGRVFWRVEAVRNDAWVRAYGAPVEVNKPAAERGKYQHPELYGQPAEKAIRSTEHMRAIRNQAATPAVVAPLDTQIPIEKQWSPSPLTVANGQGSPVTPGEPTVTAASK